MAKQKFDSVAKLFSLAASPGVALVIIAGFVAAVFALFLKAPALSDQLDYFSSALMLPDVTPTHRHLRVGLVWPLWGAIQLFGYSEVAYYLLPYLAAVFLGFGTWWLGKLMFSPAVGWVASVLVVLIPRYVSDMSYILPDYLAAGIFTLAVALIFWASVNRSEVAPSRSLLVIAMAGVLLGWAYLTREYIVVLFPCIGLALLLLKTPLRGWIAFCLGALSVYLLESIWGWLVYGDPFVRLSAAAGPRETSRPFATETWEIIKQFPSVFSDLRGGMFVAGLVTFGLLSGLIGLVSRNPGWKVIASWSVLGWVFFTLIALLPIWLFDGEAVYLRMHKFRYWALIFPPVFIGAVAALFFLAGLFSRGSRAVSTAIVVGLLAIPAYGYLSGLSQVAASGALVRVDSNDYREFREFLIREQGSLPEVFWTDYGTGVSGSNSLPIYFYNWTGSEKIWDGTLRYLSKGASTWVDRDDISTGYVILDRTRSSLIIGKSTPLYFSAPEATWATVFRSSNGDVLVFDPTRSPTVNDPVQVRASQLQVLKAPNSSDAYTAMLSGEALSLNLGKGARVLVSDDAAHGLAAPVNDVNLMAGSEAGFVFGNFHLNTRGGEVPRLRCLFYDSSKDRVSRSADIFPAEPIEAGEKYFFSCSPPVDGPQFSSFRVALELREGMKVGVEKIEYGFTEY